MTLSDYEAIQKILNTSTRIFFRDLNISTCIGIHANEKQSPQNVTINVDLYIKSNGKYEVDSIQKTLDYSKVHDGICSIGKSGKFKLQETLCERIASYCLEMRETLAVRVSTQKTEVYKNCKSVGR